MFRNNNLSQYWQNQQAVSKKSFKRFNIFKHFTHVLKRDSIINRPECLLLIKVNIGHLKVLAASQLVPALSAQTCHPTNPQIFIERFYQCHLIPQKVKVASVERGVVVSERKAPGAPILKAQDQNKPPVGYKLQCYVACWYVCWRVEWTHFKKSNYSEEANRPRSGVKRKDFESTLPCGI